MTTIILYVCDILRASLDKLDPLNFHWYAYIAVIIVYNRNADEETTINKCEIFINGKPKTQNIFIRVRV